ncbi:MAG: Uncharacterized protein G01um10148_71 [Parcubacteria group bacterium Gr01-1014_8]|nr:MAG: Uncharacterized protein G01um10148_71 [Parcubacteria group bacterium Gr01-1014_8]
MEIAVQIALNAVIAGALYSLAALGFNLVYNTARFFDLGYGAVAATGAYAVFYFYKTLQFDLLSSIALGILIAGALGFLIEKVVYRQLRARKASQTVLLIASLGVLTVVQAIIAIIFSSQFQTLSRNIGASRIYNVYGGVMTETQVIILCSGLSIMTALGIILRYTLFGKAIKAVADDEEVAQIVGINSERLIGIVFFIGSAIGGIAGIAVGFDTGIQPTMGMTLLLSGVVAAIIGGMGNVYGGVIGAFLLAAIENAGVWYLSGEWKAAIAFAILILFLLFRPQGLFQK